MDKQLEQALDELEQHWYHTARSWQRADPITRARLADELGARGVDAVVDVYADGWVRCARALAWCRSHSRGKCKGASAGGDARIVKEVMGG